MKRVDQQQLVKDRFEQLATTWSDLYTGATSYKNYNFIIRKIRVLELFDKTGGRYLDVGCGTGDFVPDLLARGGEVFATDVAPEMIEQAKAKLRSIADPAKTHFSVGDVYRLEFPSSYFDAVIGVGLLEYLLDVEGALREIYRVLKPGGIVIATVPNVASPFMAYDTAWPASKELVKRVLAPLIKRPVRQGYLHRHFWPWQLDRQLRRVGFEKHAYAFCSYGSFELEAFQSFFLWLSRKLDRFSRTPLGILGTNYILKAAKPIAAEDGAVRVGR